MGAQELNGLRASIDPKLLTQTLRKYGHGMKLRLLVQKFVWGRQVLAQFQKDERQLDSHTNIFSFYEPKQKNSLQYGQHITSPFWTKSSLNAFCLLVPGQFYLFHTSSTPALGNTPRFVDNTPFWATRDGEQYYNLSGNEKYFLSFNKVVNYQDNKPTLTTDRQLFF